MVGGIKDLEVESSDEDDEEEEDDDDDVQMHVSKQKAGKDSSMFSLFK
jgi:hypothetical protein